MSRNPNVRRSGAKVIAVSAMLILGTSGVAAGLSVVGGDAQLEDFEVTPVSTNPVETPAPENEILPVDIDPIIEYADPFGENDEITPVSTNPVETPAPENEILPVDIDPVNGILLPPALELIPVSIDDIPVSENEILPVGIDPIIEYADPFGENGEITPVSTNPVETPAPENEITPVSTNPVETPAPENELLPVDIDPVNGILLPPALELTPVSIDDIPVSENELTLVSTDPVN